RGREGRGGGCGGPEGRLWLAWGGSDASVMVTRSNRAANTFEPVQKLQLPGGALSFLQCEGSAGPADLFAAGQPNGGFSHAHVLAQISLHAQATRTKVTISARDAGDPGAGVSITAGGERLKHAANGQSE